jgi:hypothetical protein
VSNSSSQRGSTRVNERKNGDTEDLEKSKFKSSICKDDEHEEDDQDFMQRLNAKDEDNEKGSVNQTLQKELTVELDSSCDEYAVHADEGGSEVFAVRGV